MSVVQFIKNKVMKKIVLFAVAMFSMVFYALADDRPVSYDRIPESAREFISSNFPSDKFLFATVDDDLIRPDYTVVLESGMTLGFASDGSLDKIEAGRTAIPVSILPVQIAEYVDRHYPGSSYRSYDIDRRGYEVELSNGMELKFNKGFALVEVDL